MSLKVVASLLTVGCLLNRRTTSQLAVVNNSALLSPSRPEALYVFKKQVRIPDTTPYEGRLFSRFLARFPFLLEVHYWLLTYWVYQIARAMQALTMGDGTRALSQRHGEWLVELERVLSLDIELPLQHFVMARPALLWFFNKVGREVLACLCSQADLTTDVPHSDVRYGPHPSHSNFLCILVLCLPTGRFSAHQTDSCALQLLGLCHLHDLAMYASPPAPL